MKTSARKSLSYLLLPIVAFYALAPGCFALGWTSQTSVCRGFSLTENPFRYSGYYQDFESNLYYLKARYYLPKMARFISRDTYDLSNRYAYCEGNPIAKVDPSGHFDISVLGQTLLSFVSFSSFSSMSREAQLRTVATVGVLFVASVVLQAMSTHFFWSFAVMGASGLVGGGWQYFANGGFEHFDCAELGYQVAGGLIISGMLSWGLVKMARTFRSSARVAPQHATATEKPTSMTRQPVVKVQPESSLQPPEPLATQERQTGAIAAEGEIKPGLPERKTGEPAPTKEEYQKMPDAERLEYRRTLMQWFHEDIGETAPYPEFNRRFDMILELCGDEWNKAEL